MNRGERMKAILVINMPQTCGECPCHDKSDWDEGCMVMTRETDGYAYKKRMDWCPLKPMPPRTESALTDGDYVWGFASGWNACLKEIEK